MSDARARRFRLRLLRQALAKLRDRVGAPGLTAEAGCEVAPMGASGSRLAAAEGCAPEHIVAAQSLPRPLRVPLRSGRPVLEGGHSSSPHGASAPARSSTAPARAGGQSLARRDPDPHLHRRVLARQTCRDERTEPTPILTPRYPRPPRRPQLTPPRPARSERRRPTIATTLHPAVATTA